MYTRDKCIFELSEPFKTYLNNIKSFVCAKSNEIEWDFFTPHDNTHCEAIERIIADMVDIANPPPLNEIEKFLLLAAVWCHDFGMFKSIGDEYSKDAHNSGEMSSNTPTERRKIHEKISAWYLSKEYKKIFLKQEDKIDIIKDSELRNYVQIINIIIKYHRRSTFIDKCPLEIVLEREKIKCRLLSALLRLGDTLHIDSTRYDDRRFHILQISNLNRESMLHWLKSYLISNIYLDKQNQAIIVNLDLPEKKERIREGDWGENITNLEKLIINEIQEDAISVFEIFKSSRLPTYTKVQINKIFIPGFNGEKYLQLCGILSDLDLLISPNSSRAIKNALNSIKYLDDADINYNQINGLIIQLDKIYKDKISHFGLKRVIDGLKEISATSNEHMKDDLIEFVDKISIFRNEAEHQICEEVNLEKMDDKENIFLYGYSDTVLNYLKKYSLKNSRFLDRAHFYVLEGSTKRKYSINNQIEYSDGINYAIHLSNLGFKNIDIIPDISFASIIVRLKKKYNLGIYEELPNVVLLFGANGIINHIENKMHYEETNYEDLPEKIVRYINKINSWEYVFSWNEIEGNDKVRLIEYLTRKFSIDWARNADLKKIDNDKTIKVFTTVNSLSLKIDDKNMEVTCEIDDGRTSRFVPKMENGKLNIYAEAKGTVKNLNKENINFFGISYNKKLYLVRRENDGINIYNAISDHFLFSSTLKIDFERLESETSKLVEMFEENDILLSTSFKLIKGMAYDNQVDAWEVTYKTDATDPKLNRKMTYIVKKNGCEFKIYYKNNGRCILSSGHLSLALLAQKLCIKVFVIADSFKKGEISQNEMSNSGKKYWLHSQFDNWLTTQGNYMQEIDGRKIKLTNYREDEIPEDLITEIISDDLVY